MRKSDGTYTYFVPDVAYHLTKFQRGFSKVINVQGTDHYGTVARVRAGVQAAARSLKLDVPRGYPDYLLHKMLRVTRGGEEVKMSKRAGTYVTLRDLLEWVGRDATRYFLVARRADAEFTFDVDLALSQSEDNPVYYVQYAHARICSVLQQAAEKGFAVPDAATALGADLQPLTSAREQSLLNRLSAYPDTLADAADELAPHQVANYLKDLAADFHAYYNAAGDPPGAAQRPLAARSVGPRQDVRRAGIMTAISSGPTERRMAGAGGAVPDPSKLHA
jgi:arginyl-tRNA synthetase